MSQKTKQILLQLALTSSLVFGNLSWSIPAWAGILLKPIFLVVETERGQSKSILTISNTGDEPIRVRLSAAPFTYTEAGFQRLASGEKDSDLTPYLRFAPQEITIAPHQEQKVRLVSLLPPSLPDGEYRTAITVENLNQVTQKGLSVGFSLRLISLINVHKGELQPKFSLEAASYRSQQQQLMLLVHNQGQATARPDIIWKLKQGNQEVASGKTAAVLLSGRSRNVLLNQQQQLQLKKGTYQLIGEFLWTQTGQQERVPFNIEMQY
jgi:P pilus assembly chaperone PapD